MRNNDFSNENLAILDPYNTIFEMLVVVNGKKPQNKTDISIMQILIALHINLIVTNSWLPFLPNDLSHTVFAVTL